MRCRLSLPLLVCLLAAGLHPSSGTPGSSAGTSPNPVPAAEGGAASAAELPLAPAGPSGNPVDAASASAVKVFAELTPPDYSYPWQRGSSQSVTASGVMVRGPREEPWIITNAHAVDWATSVQLKRSWDDRKFDARVVAMARDGDLALLTVEDPKFWEGAVFATFAASLPSPRDQLTVVGFPVGGNTVSVTSGIVSRIDVVQYAFSGRHLLAIQTDAAINGGNSGGPALNDRGECVGLAFQSMKSNGAESIGYIIPTPVIDHFLTDIRANGTFTGFPWLGVQWQGMGGVGIRQAYHVPDGQGGLLARQVVPVGSVAGQLQEGDVLQRFDGADVASDGTVPFGAHGRIDLGYMITSKYVGSNATLGVLRDGKPMDVNVTMKKPDYLVPSYVETPPPYLLVAGLLFNYLTVPYLQSEYGEQFLQQAPDSLLAQLYYGVKNTSDQQVVVLSRVFASDATAGLEDFSALTPHSRNIQLLRFQGQPVVSLAQLAAAVAAARGDEFLTFDLDHNEVLILEAAAVDQSTQQVMKAHAIPRPMSADLAHSLGGAGAAPQVEAFSGMP
ncbi:hypothetical protein ABPG75_005634 [Micractinium tetrahymenae]